MLVGSQLVHVVLRQKPFIMRAIMIAEHFCSLLC